jgi:hypothetical protein
MTLAKQQPVFGTDRRRDFRVVLNLRLRLRSGHSAPVDGTGDLVSQYELLGRSAQRFRKEATPAGRQFVDRLMGVLDGLTALAAEQSAAGGWSPRVVVVANLSAGGIGFCGSSQYTLGTLMGLEFALPKEISAVPFRCEARVVRCDRATGGAWKIGLEFEDLTSVTQERLIRILFDVQRRRLRDRGDQP